MIDDPLGVGGGVMALKLVVLAPFRFVSDDVLGVVGVSLRQNLVASAPIDDPLGVGGVSW